MSTEPTAAELIRRTLAGERVPLARALSWVENEEAGATGLLDACFPHAGRAFRIGITGPPGAGKSTLVARLAAEYRARGLTVAIVAVDPTSPFSGGALLGDRVRMAELAGDPGVFIRSMASRGSLGGLAVHTAQVCDVLDAAGFQRILVETVGVGQSELEVAGSTDSTVVVLVPESGDAVQAMKAGLMEIADLFVMNKADREGAERAALAIRSALELRASAAGRSIPVLLTTASQGNGVPDVAQALEEHLAFLRETGGLEARRRNRLERRVRELLHDQLWREFRGRVPDERWLEHLAAVADRSLTPHQMAAKLRELAGPGGA